MSRQMSVGFALMRKARFQKGRARQSGYIEGRIVFTNADDVGLDVFTERDSSSYLAVDGSHSN
jgi:hypothetical protein